jgi:hypothetical protein
VVTNIGSLRTSAAELNAAGRTTNAVLGAADLAGGRVNYKLTAISFVDVESRGYLAARAELGSPADTPAQIARAGGSVRSAVDQQLIGAEFAARPGQAAPAGPPPRLFGGRAVVASGCLRAYGPVTFSPVSSFTVRGVGQLSARRFGAAFQAVADTLSTTVSLARDAAPQPWVVRLAGLPPDAGQAPVAARDRSRRRPTKTGCQVIDARGGSRV